MSASPAELQVKIDAGAVDVVPLKGKHAPVRESTNSLLCALIGRQWELPSHDTEEGHVPTAVSRTVILVDTSFTQTCPVQHFKVNATLVIDCKLSWMKIMPDIFSKMQKITLDIEKIEGICPGEDSF